VPAWLTKHLQHVDSVCNSSSACNQNSTAVSNCCQQLETASTTELIKT